MSDIDELEEFVWNANAPRRIAPGALKNKRGTLVAAWVRKNKTHCKHGHEFTPVNTYLYRGARHCRECQRLRDLER